MTAAERFMFQSDKDLMARLSCVMVLTAGSLALVGCATTPTGTWYHADPSREIQFQRFEQLCSQYANGEAESMQRSAASQNSGVVAAVLLASLSTGAFKDEAFARCMRHNGWLKR